MGSLIREARVDPPAPFLSVSTVHRFTKRYDRHKNDNIGGSNQAQKTHPSLTISQIQKGSKTAPKQLPLEIEICHKKL